MWSMSIINSPKQEQRVLGQQFHSTEEFLFHTVLLGILMESSLTPHASTRLSAETVSSSNIALFAANVMSWKWLWSGKRYISNRTRVISAGDFEVPNGRWSFITSGSSPSEKYTSQQILGNPWNGWNGLEKALSVSTHNWWHWSMGKPIQRSSAERVTGLALLLFAHSWSFTHR